MENKNTCILSTSYWPTIQYFSKVFKYDNIFIEQYETYPRQTYRNRIHIYSANGLQSLQIPVIKASNKNIILKDIQISYDTNWQKNHLKSIESAYRSTPFYEYYIDDIKPFYVQKTKYLLDFNNEILNTCLSILEIDKQIEYTKDFILKYDNIIDFRNTIHPKKKYSIPDKDFIPVKYIQGFEQRYGFIPNLSILDLIFNTGPETSSIVSNSILKK